VAYQLLNSSSQYFTIAAPNITVPPVTLSVWIKATSIIDKHSALFIWRDTIQTGLILRYVAPNWELRYYVAGGNQFQTATGLSLAVGVWQHACVAITSTQARLYLGANSFTNDVSHSSVAIDAAGDVGRDPFAAGVTFDGSIAEPAIWNLALSDAECRTLSLGISPLALKDRLPNLVLHKDLLRDVNRGRGPTLTPANGPSVVAHPSIRNPQSRRRTSLAPARILSPFRAITAAAYTSCALESCAATTGAAAGATTPFGEVTS
jgi:hypothetical protein